VALASQAVLTLVGFACLVLVSPFLAVAALAFAGVLLIEDRA
jgi:hypothetical protein